MHIEEAKWIQEQLSGLQDTEIAPLLNLGSSTYRFRTESQPFLDKLVVAPLKARNLEVIHSDIKEHEGVDLVGDIMDPECAEVVKNRNVRLILCSNMLEHVVDAKAMAAAIRRLLPETGRLIVTVPSLPATYGSHRDGFSPGPVRDMRSLS